MENPKTLQALTVPTGTMRKMSALLLLLGAGALLCCVDAQAAYNQLTDNYKKGVDLALQQINTHTSIQHHFLYFKDLKKNDIQPGFSVSYIYHHFHLKATKCPRGTVNSGQCQFRNDRPLIDCAACYKMYQGGIEQDPKPYIHCVHRPALTEEMKLDRMKHCNNMAYINGQPSMLLVTGTEQ